MPREPASPAADVGAVYWRLCADEPLAGAVVLDVGTGRGRVALALAPRVRHVVGIDRDAEAIADAERRATALGLRNVRFTVADADRVDFRTLVPEPPHLVTAHLFLSEPLVGEGARVLVSGGALVALGFHVDQWKETGRPSRFAFDEARMRALVTAHGLTIEHLSVEREIDTFASIDDALAAVRGHERAWQADGRWGRYRAFLEAGGRTLTRSHLVVKARKARAPA